ncbi:MAG: phosphoribosylanthranilate isomerase [Solirubrobacterales bacterium]|nr:MAG: phosphoribosylanthranilate isomerase [Solirubrobacterales bacterium]
MTIEAPKIKFCGVTNVDDAEHALAAGAWAVGVILWPHSPRRCEPGAAAEIASVLKRRAEVVGVFVNPTLAELTRTADAIELTMLQLHGDEGPVFCGEAARRTGCKLIKAVRARSRAAIQALTAFHTDFHLLDSHVPGIRGGSGETFEWELARGRRARTPLILSGGLTPGNVAGAIAAVHPFAVDVASGVELSPGHKDPDKLRAFAQAVHATAVVSAGAAGASTGPDGAAEHPGRLSAR